MKYTIIGSMMAATLLVSCGDKKKEADNSGSDKDKKEQSTAPHSKISASLEGKTKVFKDGAFVAQNVANENEYYFAYFSASF